MARPEQNHAMAVIADDADADDADAGDEDALGPLIEQIRQLAEGRAKLPAERPLAEMLGVKRHQLRRALSAMRAQGELPEPKPRVTRARGPLDMVSNTNPVEVIEMRMMIEPTLARLAALRATPARIEAMQKAVREIAEAGGEARAVDLHRMIAEASGNALAFEFYTLLRKIEMDSRLASRLGSVGRPPQDTAEHEAIVGAIARRAPDEAEAAMRAHIAEIHRVVSLGLS